MFRAEFFATAAVGTEPLLITELTELGAETPQLSRGGVRFKGSLEVAYRTCLWSRTASRVLLPLARFPVADADTLYKEIYALPWEEHIRPYGTLSVHFQGTGPGIEHSHYGAQRVKDAVVDRFRARCGQRPSVKRQRPEVRIHVEFHDGQVAVYLDLSGESLHRRGYREATGIAPLKETLAAALLVKSGWREMAMAGSPLIDPLCGSGTLVIEAAWIAGDCAPGLLRDHWGFSGWLGHVPEVWNRLLKEAQERRLVGRANIPSIWASDDDPKAVHAALRNARRAGLSDLIKIEQRELAEVTSPPGPPGLLSTNPPYGERLGKGAEWVAFLYERLGNQLKNHFSGWRVAVFTGNPELGKRMGLRAEKIHTFSNGPLICWLLHFHIRDHTLSHSASILAASENVVESAELSAPPVSLPSAAPGATLPRPISRCRESVEGFVNRLRKNLRYLGRWAAREKIYCYRLYDADLPEYAVAIARYEHWLHVQEYAPPPVSIQKKLKHV